MNTIAEILKKIKQPLENVTDQPQLEAEILLAHVLQKSRAYLYAHDDEMIANDKIAALQKLISRRLQKYPVAYLLGHKEFWSMDLQVTEHTLIPRPETELLVEIILQLPLDVHAPLKIADLGTGSGAIALALCQERPNWEIHASDVSESALQIARKNAQRLKLDRISFHLGNWCTALPDFEFDVIVSNPPYLTADEWRENADNLQHEPKNALLAEQNGLDAFLCIAHEAYKYLKPGAYLIFEHGATQKKMVTDILRNEHFTQIETHKDLAGHDRVTYGVKAQNI